MALILILIDQNPWTQTKPVFVHKLMASGTIEEKIEILKERGSAQAQSMADHDGTSTLATTQADLDFMLASP